jgi:hypothetical protein
MSALATRWAVEKCPVCLRFTHAEKCSMRGLMALEWHGASPDERAREAQA